MFKSKMYLNLMLNFILLFIVVILTKEVKTWRHPHIKLPKYLETRLETENLERDHPVEPRRYFLPPIVPKVNDFLPPIEPKQSDDDPIEPFKNIKNQHSKLPEKCGKRSVEPDEETKIINGHKATYGELPWQVRFFTSEEKSHFCGGTIISEFIVVSAAHCFYDERFNPSKFLVRVGDYKDAEVEKDEKTYHIEKLIGHEDYNPKTLDNDIAIVKIKPKKGKGIQFGKYIQPACVVEEDAELPIGKKCLVSGWGDVGGREFPSVLQTTEMKIMNQAYCKQPISYGDEITGNMFCAGDKEGSTDSCQGDSGGPFVCKHEGKFTLFGVVSWGNGCAKPKYPGIYTNVANYRKWIDENMKEDTTTTE